MTKYLLNLTDEQEALLRIALSVPLNRLPMGNPQWEAIVVVLEALDKPYVEVGDETRRIELAELQAKWDSLPWPLFAHAIPALKVYDKAAAAELAEYVRANRPQEAAE